MPKFLVDSRELFSTEEAAKQIGIGIATMWRWVKSGKVTTLQLDRRTLIPKSEIERLKRK